MTQFGIAHVAILCVAVMAVSYTLDIYPIFVAIVALGVLGYFAFARK